MRGSRRVDFPTGRAAPGASSAAGRFVCHNRGEGGLVPRDRSCFEVHPAVFKADHPDGTSDPGAPADAECCGAGWRPGTGCHGGGARHGACHGNGAKYGDRLCDDDQSAALRRRPLLRPTSHPGRNDSDDDGQFTQLHGAFWRHAKVFRHKSLYLCRTDGQTSGILPGYGYLRLRRQQTGKRHESGAAGGAGTGPGPQRTDLHGSGRNSPPRFPVALWRGQRLRHRRNDQHFSGYFVRRGVSGRCHQLVPGCPQAFQLWLLHAGAGHFQVYGFVGIYPACGNLGAGDSGQPARRGL